MNLMASNQDQDYGSIMSPNSPIKVGRANMTMTGFKQRAADVTQLKERRNTTTAGGDASPKRSSSV